MEVPYNYSLNLKGEKPGLKKDSESPEVFTNAIKSWNVCFP